MARRALYTLAALAPFSATALGVPQRLRHRQTSLLQSDAEQFAANAQAGAVGSRAIVEAPLFDVKVFARSGYDFSQGATITVDPKTQSLVLEKGVKDGVAWARVADRLGETGWLDMHVETAESKSISNDIKMYSAGFLEGFSTAERMSQFYSNLYPVLAKNTDGKNALSNIRLAFLNEIEYLKEKTGLQRGPSGAEPDDPYWQHMRYVFLQLTGIKDGYNTVAKLKGVNSLALLDLLFINSHAELPELMEAYKPDALSARVTFQSQPVAAESFLQEFSIQSMEPEKDAESQEAIEHDWEQRLIKRGHCTGLVRVNQDNSDLFVGHTTWGDFSKMTRVFKYYNFKLPGSNAAATNIGFSSYPGCVSSTDDFYLLDSGLAVMDTSLEILNPTLYNRVAEFPANPHVPNFMHVMAVNRMAQTAPHWTTLFAERNSGTNNAQWVIVDYKRFTPGTPIGDNTVRVLEIIPGVVYNADVSGDVATKGYWASFNRPVFQTIRAASGHTAAEAKYGALFSVDNSPRGVIFQRRTPSITSLTDMRVVMNSNDYPKEKVIPGTPGHAISARMDLDVNNGKIPNGGIDAKVTNRCLFKSLQCQAISGPTHDVQPVFTWKGTEGVELFPGWPHLGLPDVYNFSWVQMGPMQMRPFLEEPASC